MKGFSKRVPSSFFCPIPHFIQSNEYVVCSYIPSPSFTLLSSLSRTHTHTQLCIKKEESTARISLFIATYTLRRRRRRRCCCRRWNVWSVECFHDQWPLCRTCRIKILCCEPVVGQLDEQLDSRGGGFSFIINRLLLPRIAVARMQKCLQLYDRV